MIIVSVIALENPVFKMFSVETKTQVGALNSFGFTSVSQNLRYLDGLVW